MFDIEFYMKAHEFKKSLMGGHKKTIDEVFESLENFRSKDPIVYNIETTNACNMRCRMCPRTTLMKRAVETMDMPTFVKIIDQIKPFSKEARLAWESFAREKYGIKVDEVNENHFFLYVIPKVLVLHGYGDPLLDRQMPERVRLLAKRGVASYFSCNPANINIDRVIEIFEGGLDYIKFSIESVDDALHKQIRGSASDFTQSYQKIISLLDLKRKRGYATKVIVTMLDLGNARQSDEFRKLQEAFCGRDVYAYLKSQDQKWYEGKSQPTKSIHWSEFCQFPWSSMTIKSNGEAVECVEDYDNEIILGDAKTERLYDIWNGSRYSDFRRSHFDLTGGIKCTQRCDMRLIGSFV